jgi:multidrug efflux pump
MLTLIVTPALLALRIWIANGAYSFKAMLAVILLPRDHPTRRDLRLKRAARNAKAIEINWEQKLPDLQTVQASPSHAAE